MNNFKDARGHIIVIGMSVVFSRTTSKKYRNRGGNTNMAWGVVSKINPVTIGVKINDGTIITKSPHKVVVATLPMVL